MGNLKALLPAEPKEPLKGFKAYEPGYVHVDVKYLPQIQDQSSRSYLFVAIDRAHALGVRADQGQQERCQCESVSEGPAQGLPDQNQQGAH